MLIQETVLLSLLLPSSSKVEATTGQHETENQTRIAIIGAGIGGASAAYNIHKLNCNLRFQQITVFERENVVGGRIQSIYLYPDTGGLKVIEDGASHFSADDWCLMSAMQDVGLKAAQPHWLRPFQSSEWTLIHRLNPPRIWRAIKSIRDIVKQDIDMLLRPRADGIERIDLNCNVESIGWPDYLRIRWKYGYSWQMFHSEVQSTLEKWNVFGGPYHPPFTSIMQELRDIGLTENVTAPATAYLRNLSVSTALQNKLIQSCARGQISQDLSDVSGLSALIAAGRTLARSVNGGNSRLVERMIRLSGADVRLGVFVTAIMPGFSRRYRLSISNSKPHVSAEDDDLEFDVVILAAPLTSNELDISSLDPRANFASTEYFETHVTHFSSSIPLSSNLSILPLDINIVDGRISTISTTVEHPKILNIQRSDACFTRHCVAGPELDECDQCDDDIFLYRVHSREHMQDEDLVQLIGLGPKEDNELSDSGIQFVRRRAWPHAFPRRSEGRVDIVDRSEIAQDLYYLNGAESLVSSMEMNCRMGRNVAHKASSYGRHFFRL